MDKIDAIYYINLDHREDRNREFLECMSDLDVPVEKIQRISAIYNRDMGALGCTRSHIKAIETFLESGLKTCLVCEDDFQYKNKDTFWSDIKRVFDTNVEFDILQLSYNPNTYTNMVVYKSRDTIYPFLKKAEVTITASGYIITRNFAPTLLENFKESSNNLAMCNGLYSCIHTYSLDQYWNILKPKSNWYIIYPPIGYQRSSYSDILNQHVTYNT